MSIPTIEFKTPHPPHLATSNPIMFTIGLLVGLFSLLAVTAVVDKLGSAMFRRGFAKPFYIRGRRIHHNVLYVIIPVAYCAFSILYLLGYVTLSWSNVWGQLGILSVIVAVCMVTDAIGDKFWPEIRKNVILHHEWIYTLIPAYIFAFMFIIVV